MASARAGDRSLGVSIELGLLLIVLSSLAWVIVEVILRGYIPPPFFYDTLDTFMDWYNSAYWANNSGAYDVWQTVYPPLSFVFLRLVSFHACYVNDPFFARDCDWTGRVAIFGFYLLNGLLVFLNYRAADRRTALMRATAIVLGLPMLYTLERGNLIIPSFTFFVLGCGRLLRSARLRWLSLALAINFKPYLVVVVLARLVRRRWRWVEGCGLAVLAVYLLSYALEGAGTPAQIWTDINVYAKEVPDAFVLAQSYYSSSYTPLISLLSSHIPLMNMMGSRLMDTLGMLLPFLIHLGQLGVVAAFLGAAWKPTTAPIHRLGAMSLAFVLTSSDPGGYTQVFLLFLLFFEQWRGVASVILIVSAYLLNISGDYELGALDHHIREIYVTGRVASYPLGINVGQIMRPLLILIIEYSLVVASLVDLWHARAPVRLRRAGPEAPLEASKLAEVSE